MDVSEKYSIHELFYRLPFFIEDSFPQSHKSQDQLFPQPGGMWTSWGPSTSTRGSATSDTTLALDLRISSNFCGSNFSTDDFIIVIYKLTRQRTFLTMIAEQQKITV